MRAALVVLALSTLLVAGCGGEGVVAPTAKEVSGTLPKQTSTVAKGDPAAGKKLFASNGCGGCHTFKPAGSNGKTGPDLDKLAQYAKQANQGSLAEFTHESIVNPNAYVEKGYPKGVMPSFKQLSSDDLNALVDFLTKPQQ
jgi:mono/diheme cytochrome c family protein